MNKTLKSIILNVKIVKFDGGYYRIRKGWFFYKYKDLTNVEFWWSISEYPFDTRTKDLQRICAIYDELVDKNDDGVVVEIERHE